MSWYCLDSGFGGHQSEHGIAVRRSDRQPSFTGLDVRIEDHAETELIPVEAQALFLVANENIYAVDAKQLLGE